MPIIARYAVITGVPLALLLLGAVLGGPFAVMALLWLTVIAAVMDKLLAPPPQDAGAHAPWSDRLSAVLAIGHLTLLPVVLASLAAFEQGGGQKLALFVATASFFGQVSHPNAHELIHRRALWLRGLGAAVYTSIGMGHHVSAHRLVHHRHVGTPDDPNTPLPGESFWAYVPRAHHGSFMAGLAQEVEKLDRRSDGAYSYKNPYYIWVGGAVVTLIIAGEIAGLVGIVGLIALAALTHLQILLSDYIQHYGLQRLELPGGRYEPVAAHHSWNAPKGFSSFLMLNAPSHSEHHLHPDRPYDQLDTGAPAPTLPYAVPIMAMLATVPPVWHKLMDRRALRVMEAAAERLQNAPPVTPRPARPRAAPATTERGTAEDADALIARLLQSQG